MKNDMRFKLSLKFRKPLKSDNLNDTMKVNRIIGSRSAVFLYIAFLDILFFLCFNYLYNTISILPKAVKGLIGEHGFKDGASGKSILGFDNFFIKQDFSKDNTAVLIYSLFFLFMAIFTILTAYKMRVSYSEKDINKGVYGTQRWTCIEEIVKQYKKVPLRPCKTVLISLTEKEKNLLLGYKKHWKEGESIVIQNDNKRYNLIDDKVMYNGTLQRVEGEKVNNNHVPTHKIIRPLNYFAGKGGMPISRWRGSLFIDTGIVNNLIDGTTRSGKGEMLVHESIDLSSRSREIKDRSSMIIFDPKLELYKSWIKRLQERGYIVRLINIDDPLKSAGYNPLAVVAKHYKEGNYEKAQQQAKTYAFGVFSTDINLEAIWKNTATDLFTSLIIAQVSDCIELDELLNYQRRRTLKEKQKQFESLSDKLKIRAIERWEFVKGCIKEDEDPILNPMASFIPTTEKYFDIFPNEKNINCFSVINFFKDLCDRAAIKADGSNADFEKKAETLLDNYFNQRPKLDFAASLYASIKSAGARTKGSIYTNMQSQLTMFSLNNIAQMTAENDVDFDMIGFGKTPVAVFLGVPSEDKSNHFLATTFISQVYQYLFNKAKAENGKTARHVKFILDEFGNMPLIYNYENFVTVCLGANISFDLYLQSYSQLKTLYKDAAETIKENCANHFYIMSVGNDSAEEFSKMLGKKTVIEVQRTGTRLGMNKTFMESSKERPLMYPEELQVLREGECCIYRGMKRTDNARASVLSYPIINEYSERVNLQEKIKTLISVAKSRKKRGKSVNSDTGEPLTFKEEYTKKISDIKKYKGTALLYRHEYMSDYIPDSYKINFDDVCCESRSHIDYASRVNDPEKTILRLKKYYENKSYVGEKRLCDLRLYPRFYNMLVNALGDDFYNLLGIDENTKVGKALEVLGLVDLNRCSEGKEDLNGDLKAKLINLIKRD